MCCGWSVTCGVCRRGRLPPNGIKYARNRRSGKLICGGVESEGASGLGELAVESFQGDGAAAGDGGLGEDAGDVEAGDFDALQNPVPRGGAHFGDGLNAEEEGEGGGVAELGVVDVLDVAEAALEVLGAGLQPEAPLGLDFAGLAGEVAAAVSGVFADVAKDVDELEAFAHAGAPVLHLGGGDGGVERAGELGGAELGPKFADAAGDEPGVFIELRRGGEAAEAAVCGKAADVEHLAVDDVLEDVLDGGEGCGPHGAEPGDAVGEFFHEAALGVVALLGAELGDEGGGEALDITGATDEGAVALEAVEADGGADEGGVCDGVCRAGEEVGEGDGLAELFGESFEGEVEGTGDGGEELAAEFAFVVSFV